MTVAGHDVAPMLRRCAGRCPPRGLIRLGAARRRIDHHTIPIMRITFKLFATLTDYLPAEARRSNVIELDVSPDAPISKIIEPFGLPPKLVHLVLVNGKYVEPDKRMSTTLQEGDALAIWPPIAGG
jgi:hypothetical protein